MEIKGKIIRILPLQKGKSAKGEWKKQDFIIETQEQYPKKVCITVWNDKFDLNSFEGKLVTVSFDIESREFKERWYTDVKAWKIESLDENKQEAPEQPWPKDEELKDLPWDEESENDADDLPF